MHYVPSSALGAKQIEITETWSQSSSFQASMEIDENQQ